jgi:hypothetical protein
MRKYLCMACLMVILTITGCSSSSKDDPVTGEQINDQNGKGNMPVLYNEWEIKDKTPLLNYDGTLAAWGWSRHPLMEYNRDRLTAEQKKRLKEWDFYSVYNSDYCFEITMANISWMVLITVSLSDYKTNENFSNMCILFNTDTLTPPLNPYDNEVFDRGGVYSAYTYSDGIKKLTFDFPESVIFGPDIKGEIKIQDDPADDSLATAAPFKETGSFFYTDKVFAKRASGSVFIKGREYAFSESDSYAVLDWGRGVWPKEFEWGWAVASGEVGGKVLGFNFGFGEEDSSRFVSNAIVYDGVIHKLGRIEWSYNKDDIMQPWSFKSKDGRFDIKMECDFDHSQEINLYVYYMKTIQPRGRFSGRVVLDDGTVLEVKDILGFAEHCFQKW